jgi:hypothetical protein
MYTNNDNYQLNNCYSQYFNIKCKYFDIKCVCVWVGVLMCVYVVKNPVLILNMIEVKIYANHFDTEMNNNMYFKNDFI